MGRGAKIGIVVLNDDVMDVGVSIGVVDVGAGAGLTGARKPICERSSTPTRYTALSATPYTSYLLGDCNFC